jgi:hypothetical protein
MSNNIKVSYNANFIKNSILWEVKNIIFKWKGIIYGGFVRDYIIADHYQKLFWDKHAVNKYTYTDYWNEKIDKATLLRTLIPKDIDVCLYNKTDMDKMMGEIKELVNRRFGISNVTIEDSILTNDSNEYINRPAGSLYRYEFKIRFGTIPYVSNGIEIDINLDIIISNSKQLMPPFNKLDFLCNGFMMTQDNDVKLSPCTGTGIDKLKLVERKEIEFKIIRDIINFKTDYCMQFPDATIPYTIIRYNEQACRRIEKMIYKKNMWNIQNMPFVIEQYTGTDGPNCCICCDVIKNKEKAANVPVYDSNKKKLIQGSYFHADCFFKYLNSQIRNKITEIFEDEPSIIETAFLKCPFRNNIDFNRKDIQDVIAIYLNKFGEHINR